MEDEQRAEAQVRRSADGSECSPNVLVLRRKQIPGFCKAPFKAKNLEELYEKSGMGEELLLAYLLLDCEEKGPTLCVNLEDALSRGILSNESLQWVIELDVIELTSLIIALTSGNKYVTVDNQVRTCALLLLHPTTTSLV
jgi:hypothetical protein